jgi:hypothetical protein
MRGRENDQFPIVQGPNLNRASFKFSVFSGEMLAGARRALRESGVGKAVRFTPGSPLEIGQPGALFRNPLRGWGPEEISNDKFQISNGGAGMRRVVRRLACVGKKSRGFPAERVRAREMVDPRFALRCAGLRLLKEGGVSSFKLSAGRCSAGLAARCAKVVSGRRCGLPRVALWKSGNPGLCSATRFGVGDRRKSQMTNFKFQTGAWG